MPAVADSCCSTTSSSRSRTRAESTSSAELNLIASIRYLELLINNSNIIIVLLFCRYLCEYHEALRFSEFKSLAACIKRNSI